MGDGRGVPTKLTLDEQRYGATTLHSWREEIARMWRFSRNNGITEGFHTKMEMISRRAFGLRTLTTTDSG